MIAPRRLIATDLDGTLLRSDGTVSARTRRAIVCALEAGIAIVLVTARPPRILCLLAQLSAVAEVTLSNDADGVALILERETAALAASRLT